MENEDFSDNSLYFPIYEWEFYPDKLLSPSDFNIKNELRREYFTIGERTSMTRNSAFGKGTYRLNVILPKHKKGYTLYLPEIFDSYKLYIGNELYLDMGDAENGRTEIQNRCVTFSASGQTQIIISANSSTHFYSGMIYTPVFGSPLAVSRATAIYNLLTVVIATMAFICFILSVWLGFRMKQHHIKIFALLCMAVTGYTGYSLIHTFTPVYNTLTYTLEIGAYYAMFLLVILLNNKLCDLPRLWKIINTSISVFVLITAVVFSLCSGHLGIDDRNVFSSIFTLYKWCFSANLLGSGIYAIIVRQNFSAPLFYATVFFAISIICDRIFALYEPIYGGWFGEIGGLVVIIVLGYIIWSDIINAYHFNIIFAEQKKQMERQLRLQKAHYDTITDRIAETRRLQHDMRQHFRVMTGYLSHKSYDELLKYLQQLEGEDYVLPPVILCQNPLIDALLQFYGMMCLKEEIDFDSQLSASNNLPISDGDLSVLLGNLLENAYEACTAITDENLSRMISIHGSCSEDALKIQIRNTTDKEPKMRGNKFYSTKHEGMGIGTNSVRMVVEKHSGIMDIQTKNNEFRVSIIISF